MKDTRSKYTTLKQIINKIPSHLTSKLARKYGVDKKSRSFSPWSHVVSLLFVQLAHSLSLNDVVDTLRNNSEALYTIREATPPSRNGLSYANRERNAEMMKALFWSVMSSLQSRHPKFGYKEGYTGIPRRFKRAIHAVDSTTIQLVANSVDWAKHRRRKAAAKCHMKLNLQTFLPEHVIVKAASSHDSREAFELCSMLKDGEVVVFDKAYVDYKHLNSLTQRGVFWVTRAKTNMDFKVMGQHIEPKVGIITDDEISLCGMKAQADYPQSMRFVKAMVKVDKKEKEMSFITNNFTWASSSICDLYKSRWGVEVFFKQMKQTLQLADFLGHNENAVKWQIWSALLVYVLLRFIAFESKWSFSFARLFTLLRGILWSRYDLSAVLHKYISGTAHGPPRTIAAPQQSYLPGFF